MSEALPFFPSLVGPTASGKTGLAIALAERLDLEVISADSRQVYRQLDIGTAKPTAEERAAVPHHVIDVVDPDDAYSAVRFMHDARKVADDIRARGKLALMVGGSGLYVRAAEHGIFEAPDVDPELRARLKQEAAERGSATLHRRLAEVDPPTAGRIHENDAIRITRALEVYEQTGVALSEHHRRHAESAPKVRALRLALDWPTVTLDHRIERRIDAMLDAGWGDEVKGLLDRGYAEAPALNALGYREVEAWVRGETSRAECREKILKVTRQFSKRQRTWFRGAKPIQWIRVNGVSDFPRVVDEMEAAIRGALEEPASA